ncbi:MAG: TonB-dependent receptor [Betaproteobacteria bacterium]|nr:TonB-dependent receptor [Betaproteobacteria bacterium]
MKNPASALAARPLATLLSLVASSVCAQSLQTPVSLQQTVVTATRLPQTLTESLADVSVLDPSTIERSGAVGLVDVLSRLPGVEFARNGGPGGTTGVFVRGGETRFTAVYIDGVRVDSQSTGGAPWESIPLAQIDRIEVLRGPAAAVYGSDAIAGVIQIFTKKGEGAFSPSLGLSLGRYGTRKLEATASGSVGDIDYSVGLADVKSTGFNATTRTGQNPDVDGMTSQSGNVRLGLKINTAHRVEATALSNKLNSQYDSSTRFADERNLYKLQALGFSWQAQWRDDLNSRLTLTESLNRYETTPLPYLTLTRLRGITLLNEYRMGNASLTAALERKEDWLENAPINQGRSQNALALGYGMRSGAHSLQLNLRHDNDSEFGGKSTGSAAYGHNITPFWRVTASAGTAFRAPTLYQRFSIYGLPSLQPESARNAELALRYTEGSTQVQVVAYRNRVSDLITFVSAPGPCVAGSGSFPGCYGNTAQARYEGVTLSGKHAISGYALRGSLDLQNPQDLTLNKQLPRRAKQHANLGLDKRIGNWLLGAEAQLVGKRFSGAGETLLMGGYALFGLVASSRIAPDWSMVVRIDNLSDKRYETANGYATPGRSAMVGLKWQPQ